MKIVIDARMIYWTGVGRYTRALLDNLEQIDTENEYMVLMRPEDLGLWKPTSPNFAVVETAVNPYSLGEQLRLPKVIEGLAPDLVHFTTPNAPVLYRGRRMLTVHDLTLLDYDTSRGTGLKRWVRGLKRLPFRLVFWLNVRSAAGLTTCTAYVKGQLVKRFRVPAERIAVALLAYDPQLAEPAPIEKFGAGEQYLLYVGNFYPYKNVSSTVEALKLLGVKYPSLKLVIVGKSDYFRDRVMDRVRELGLSERVVFTGFVSDEELVGLYRKAALYVYPSLSEGFGLQGLEAMGAGVPVLAAQASCLPEVYGDAAVYFDPHNVKDQAEKIADLLANDGLRERLVAAGKRRVTEFSWRRMAETTLAAYREAARLK